MNVRIYPPSAAELHTVRTAAVGTNWTPLPDIKCSSVTIINTTGVTISVKYNAQAAPTAPDLGYLDMPTGATKTFSGTSVAGGQRSAKSISVKRSDSSNTQVDVGFETTTV